MKWIQLEGTALANGRRPAATVVQSAVVPGDGALPFSALDHCRLAEECFILAALVTDPEAAAELVEAGDDYLRCAAEAAPLVPLA
jgi:hypothetical protein